MIGFFYAIGFLLFLGRVFEDVEYFFVDHSIFKKIQSFLCGERGYLVLRNISGSVLFFCFKTINFSNIFASDVLPTTFVLILLAIWLCHLRFISLFCEFSCFRFGFGIYECGDMWIGIIIIFFELNLLIFFCLIVKVY